MRLDPKAFGLATGVTAGLLFVLCALAVAIAPDATTAFAGYLIHVDLSGLSRTLTFGSFVGGLLAWTISTAVTFWISALIYNRLVEIAAPRSLATPLPWRSRHRQARGLQTSAKTTERLGADHGALWV